MARTRTFRAIFNLSFRIIEGLAGELGAGYGAFDMEVAFYGYIAVCADVACVRYFIGIYIVSCRYGVSAFYVAVYITACNEAVTRVAVSVYVAAYGYCMTRVKLAADVSADESKRPS